LLNSHPKTSPDFDVTQRGDDMRITDIETVTVNIPFKATNRSAGRVGRGVTRTIVWVHTNEDVTGLGETLHGQSKHVIDHVLAPVLIGEDPLDIHRLRSRCLMGRGMYGAPGRAWETDPWAYSGVEMALYDIAGKVSGVPLYRLFGGAHRRRVPFVAYVYPHAERMTPPEIAEDCARTIRSTGAATLELKVGVLEPRLDIETIRRSRDMLGPHVSIRIDANGAWSVETAVSTLLAVEGSHLANAEEPCRGLDSMARVRQNVTTPLSTHCAEVSIVASLKAADNIVFDLPSEGGLDSARETAAAAEALGLGFWMRSTGELGIGTAAILHLAAGTRHCAQAHQTVLHLLADDILTRPFPIREGCIEVPEGPGLGVELDRDRVDAYARLHAEEGTYWFWGQRRQPGWTPPPVW
jgi:glucarate dehydratase